MWALSYGKPYLLRRLCRSLSRIDPQRWELKLLKAAPASLFLPCEYLYPDYQIFQSTAGTPARALVCYTGRSLRLNIPVQLFHCAVAECFDVIIYLRDRRRSAYAEGVPGLGDNSEALTASLARHLPPGSRISVLATSEGGIAASRTANDLGASRLALFSPSLLSKASLGVPSSGVSNVDSARLFFAKDHPPDWKRAREWCGVKHMPQIEWLKTSSHGTLEHLATTEQLGSLIEWLAGGQARRLE
jgi:hypothetical protein